MPKIGPPQGPNPYQDIKMPGAEIKGAALNKDPSFIDPRKKGQLDKDAFLKLFSHQLRLQDPLNPADQKKFAADLAQFSQLEQLANLNKHFKKAASPSSRELKLLGASFLGKKISAKGGTFSYDGLSQTVELPFFLRAKAEGLSVKIFNGSNELIRGLSFKDRPEGPQSVFWDGRTFQGGRAKAGTYRFEVRGQNGEKSFLGHTKTEGLVTGVSFTGKELLLLIDGKKAVFLKDVETLFSPQEKDTALQNSLKKAQ